MRELGFEVAAIRTLLALQDQPEISCGQIDALVGDHLAAVDDKINRLLALRKELQQILACCKGGRVAEFRTAARAPLMEAETMGEMKFDLKEFLKIALEEAKPEGRS